MLHQYFFTVNNSFQLLKSFSQYCRHVLSRKVTKEDIGLTIMYRDYYMTGWSCKDVSPDDVNLVPVISGEYFHIPDLCLL
jgi:hypothetical protein